MRLRGVETGTLISWHPGRAVTLLEFLKKKHLQEPGNIGMKDFYKFSDLCVCVCVCSAHAKVMSQGPDLPSHLTQLKK